MWNLALDMAALRHRVLFISLEQTTGETAVQAVTRYSRVRLDRFAEAQAGRATLTDGEQAGLAKAAEKIAESEMYLRLHGSEQHGRSIDDVLRSAQRARFDAIFIDHIGMIGRDEGDELKQLARSIDRLRALARGEVKRDYRPFVCCTSPLNRDSEKDGEEERLPQLRDFRGSGRIESDADLAMILRKRKQVRADDCDEPDLVDGFVLKNRSGRAPLVLLFEAQGAICSVNERRPDGDAGAPQHWQEERE